MLFAEWDMETALEVQFEEGWEAKQMEDVKNLYEYGMSAEQIAIALKLPLEKVTQYLNQA